MCEDCHVGLQVQWNIPSQQVSGSERPRQLTGTNGTSSCRADAGAGPAGSGLPGREDSEEAGAPHRPSSIGSQAQQAPDHDGDGERVGASSSAAVWGTTTRPAADAPEVDLGSFESLLSAGKELFRQVHTL